MKSKDIIKILNKALKRKSKRQEIGKSSTPTDEELYLEDYMQKHGYNPILVKEK